jgi:transcriptional regulator with XRE-family HTH domain
MYSLTETRKLQNVDQRDLAQHVGISATALSFIENGRAAPTNQTKKRIESLLGEINWMRTVKPKKRVTNYYSLETELRSLLYGVRSLEVSEKQKFVEMIKTYCDEI